MTVDINVILFAGLFVSFYLHYKQHKKNDQEKTVEYHTHNYYTDVMMEDEEGMRF